MGKEQGLGGVTDVRAPPVISVLVGGHGCPTKQDDEMQHLGLSTTDSVTKPGRSRVSWGCLGSVDRAHTSVVMKKKTLFKDTDIRIAGSVALQNGWITAAEFGMLAESYR